MLPVIDSIAAKVGGWRANQTAHLFWLRKFPVENRETEMKYKVNVLFEIETTEYWGVGGSEDEAANLVSAMLNREADLPESITIMVEKPTEQVAEIAASGGGVFRFGGFLYYVTSGENVYEIASLSSDCRTYLFYEHANLCRFDLDIEVEVISTNIIIPRPKLDSDPEVYGYIPLFQCVKSGQHLKSCDEDGFCNSCGEQ